MLIWLEGSPADYPAGLSNQILEALTELGEAGYKARHIVACRRDVAKHLASINGISERAKAYFYRFYGEFTQLGSVLAIPDYYVASLSVVIPVEVGGVWHVPLSYFSDERYAEELTVVCENDTDYEIYEVFAKAWLLQNFPSCVVSTKSRAGHGGSTVTVLRRLATNPNPMHLCLLDSDKTVVLGREGSTARGVRAAWVDSWRANLYVLSCRELENALPIVTVGRCLNSLNTPCSKIDQLDLVDGDLLDYACMKTGERLCRFHEVDNSHVGYQRTIHALRETSRRHPDFTNCGVNCGDCDCEVIPALGERFLERFSGWIRSSNSVRALPQCDDWPEEIEVSAALLAKKAIALPRRQ